MAPRILAVVVLLTALAGCGGDDGDGDGDGGAGGGNPPMTKRQVIDQSNRICADAMARSREYASEHRAPQNAREVAAALGETIKQEAPALEELERLRPPDEQRATFDQFLDAQRLALDINRRQQRAAESLEEGEFGRLAEELTKQVKRIKEAADRYGIESSTCARLPFPFTSQGGG
jgi:hypothetical protein